MMYAIKTSDGGETGPFRVIEQLSDHWLADGIVFPITVIGEDATIEPYTPKPVQRPPEVVQAEIVAATQDRLDAFARTRHYDDIKSASDYAGCSVPRFDAEGTYARDARAETWEALYTMLAEVQAGTRPMPTGFADIEPELPPLVWPTP